ncbi:electron transfer flavoprotein subunit alpha/FixB family protein [Sedimentibacter sp. zth1]|uniref:electron transfer flavoprotein subunit alpha/FixB family protein n=1 Tax=Sedimentibacter sp. zth1 TaxID=2816908 RepID=UPI001A929C12|nr:electron transfer flavoprotein subunit alpha/FixB family protein [Sedimentibacter sp. zth1]QSX05651.1 electron transfer flavoprotein subunit alpha/FixB family protein [Sedimentibacter sp. zth1]
MKKEIWAICDDMHTCNNGYFKGLVSKTASLAHEGGYIATAVCIGKFDKNEMGELFHYGLDKIVYCKNTNEILDDSYLKILEYAIKQKKPKMIMFPASEIGRKSAAYMSITFEAGLTAECIEISLDELNEFVYKRAAVNSSAIAKIKCVNCDIEMCTVKNNVFDEIFNENMNEINIEILKYDIDISKMDELVKKLSSESITIEKKVDISSARIVLAIGRGIKDKETIDLIFSLAKKLGAEVVGTRAAMEENTIEKFRQVGQSGISICPDIYVGFGITGASQHMVGIKNSKIIVAVNTDENAPIFNYADYVIVEDATVVLKEIEKSLI